MSKTCFNYPYLTVLNNCSVREIQISADTFFVSFVKIDRIMMTWRYFIFQCFFELGLYLLFRLWLCRLLAEEFERTNALEELQRELQAKLTEEQVVKDLSLREKEEALRQQQEQLEQLRLEKIAFDKKLLVRNIFNFINIVVVTH